MFIYRSKNRPLPSFKWIKTSNNTHGYIRATVDFSVGPKPINVYGYHARTLNDKRFVDNSKRKPIKLIHIFFRRDFRLVIGDPNHPGKAIANPVIWFKNNVVLEVRPFSLDKRIKHTHFLLN